MSGQGNLFALRVAWDDDGREAAARAWAPLFAILDTIAKIQKAREESDWGDL